MSCFKYLCIVGGLRVGEEDAKPRTPAAPDLKAPAIGTSTAAANQRATLEIPDSYLTAVASFEGSRPRKDKKSSVETKVMVDMISERR